MREKTTLRRYGRWAGDPKGMLEDTTRCIVEVRAPGRGIHFYQCQRKRGFGPNKQYCKHHDPAAVATREKERKVHRKEIRQLVKKETLPVDKMIGTVCFNCLRWSGPTDTNFCPTEEYTVYVVMNCSECSRWPRASYYD